MNYISRVSSTLKGGCEVELAPKTIIFGPNGSGKSTIIQAIELATCGWVSDSEGRARVKQSQAIARMFPSSTPKEASCLLSTGQDYSWELQDGAKEGSYKKPEQNGPPIGVSWPVQDLMDILSGDAASVQAWLEKQVFRKLSSEEALGKLPPAVRPAVGALMKRKGITDFLGLAKAARAESKSLRAQATRSEKTIDKMVEGIQPPLTAHTRSELEKALADLPTATAFVTQDVYDQRRAELDSLAVEAATLQNSVQEVDPKVQDSLRKIKASLKLMDTHAHEFGSPEEFCWVCGSNGQSGHRQTVEEALDSLGDLVAREAVGGMLKEVLASLTKCAEDFKSLQVGSDVERTALMSKLVADNTARQSWDNAEASKKEVTQLRAKADLLTVAAKSLSCVGRDLLNQAKSGLEEKINAFLPEGESVGIDLASARIGLIREEEIHSALSGAESSRVLLALASALGGDSTLSILVPQDRAWDSGTLEATMEALAESPFQVIVMSTVKPKPVEGWVLIDLTEEKCH